MIQILSLRQIRSRIRTVEDTQKLTHAMEMISASKLKSADKILIAASVYYKGIQNLLDNLLSVRPLDNPFLREKQDMANCVLCVVTSDTGLCGLYNYNVINTAKNFVNTSGNIKIIAIGTKGLAFFKKKGFPILDSYIGFHGRYTPEIGDDIFKRLTALFLSKEADEIYIAYTRFYSATRYVPVIEKFLGIERKAPIGKDYILEPSADLILEKLIPEYLSNKIKVSLLNAFASEHAARLISMTKATDNADELLDSLVLLRNKVRQANITKEITEIISSAEALRG